ncbi:serine/threonine-protein kinase [Phytomonospora endophytica]|uniref:Protein kinase domain-containing protein n=1 Tax=Phytomonospora endophytica TaxID=714109 RepID=A0A841FMA0_9ACTN|nr:serine/threonine-protein kinase [Phytomonospora endophytica]MBB6034327.1 hypothetical protein [Phytomonospora endophytica]GIG66722.1 protein kinase [Phytomonospora endophytica]
MVEVLDSAAPGRVGPFRLTGRLGRGTMGTVYLGRSPGGRLVAVKVVSPGLAANAEFRRRFAHEVAATRTVGGFHTAEVVGAEAEAEIPWPATAYIPGPTLQQAVETQGPLPHPAVLVLAAGLAEALAAVHARGVVHGDLKSTNVILGEDGPRVVDFGIANAMETTNLSTTLHDSAVFLSPEQIRGLPAGPATDVFSFGCVIAFAATGRHPFGTGTPIEVLRRVLTAEPGLSGLPAPLARLVKVCLAGEPAAQPGLAAILRGLSRPIPRGVPWLPPKVAEMVADRRVASARRAPGRRGLLTAGLAVAAAAVSVPLGAALASRQAASLVPGTAKPGGPALVPLATLDLDSPDTTTALAFSRDGKTLAVSVEEGVSVWDIPSRTKKAVHRVTGSRGPIGTVAFAPDGTLAAGFGAFEGLAMDIGAIALSDPSGEPIAILKTASDDRVSLDPMGEVSFSADGGLVAGGRSGPEGIGKVVVWDVATHEQVRELIVGAHKGGDTAAVRSAVLSPDGGTLVAGWGAGLFGGLAFWDLPSYKGLETPEMDTGALGATGLSFTADGTKLAVAYGGVGVWDVAARTLAVELFPAGNMTTQYQSVSITPDGKTVAASFAGRGGALALWDVASGESLGTYTAGRSGGGELAFSPDGRTLAGLAGSAELRPIVELWTVA